MKGIDTIIEAQRLMFAQYLWPTNNCQWYGRCQINARAMKGNISSVIPEVLNAGTKEYTNVLLNDSYDSISFFDVQSERTIETATVDIYFAVRLDRLYPTVQERATEYVLSDVALALKRGGFFVDVVKITDGYDGWKQWTIVRKEDNMQPFYLFKFRTNTQYSLTC